MAQTFYIAKNGKEYLTASDAEVKGGGLVARRTPMGELREKVRLTKAERDEIKKRNAYESNQAVRYEVNGSFDQTQEEEVDVAETAPATEEKKDASGIEVDKVVVKK